MKQEMVPIIKLDVRNHLEKSCHYFGVSVEVVLLHSFPKSLKKLSYRSLISTEYRRFAYTINP